MVKYPLIKMLIVCIAYALLFGCAKFETPHDLKAYRQDTIQKRESYPNNYNQQANLQVGTNVEQVQDEIKELKAMVKQLIDVQHLHAQSMIDFNSCQAKCAQMARHEDRELGDDELNQPSDEVKACFDSCDRIQPLDQPRVGC